MAGLIEGTAHLVDNGCHETFQISERDLTRTGGRPGVEMSNTGRISALLVFITAAE